MASPSVGGYIAAKIKEAKRKIKKPIERKTKSLSSKNSFLNSSVSFLWSKAKKSHLLFLKKAKKSKHSIKTASTIYKEFIDENIDKKVMFKTTDAKNIIKNKSGFLK